MIWTVNNVSKHWNQTCGTKSSRAWCQEQCTLSQNSPELWRQETSWAWSAICTYYEDPTAQMVHPSLLQQNIACNNIQIKYETIEEQGKLHIIRVTNPLSPLNIHYIAWLWSVQLYDYVVNVLTEIWDFHGGENSSPGHLSCDVKYCCGRIPMFWRTSLPPQWYPTTTLHSVTTQKTIIWPNYIHQFL
jgi:hypothetical protein